MNPLKHERIREIQLVDILWNFGLQFLLAQCIDDSISGNDIADADGLILDVSSNTFLSLDCECLADL